MLLLVDFQDTDLLRAHLHLDDLVLPPRLKDSIPTLKDFQASKSPFFTTVK